MGAMPITGILWTGTSNQDIHVLRGQRTRDLTRADLQFIEGNNRPFAHDYLLAHQDPANHDVDLTFAVVPEPADDAFANQGIDVDVDTGQVDLINAGAPPPQPNPRTNNFIIQAMASDPADDSEIDHAIIRVHIHTSVTDFGLTPATLTIRPAASTRIAAEQTAYRFTLRAMFDDGTMGDLTEHHSVTWSSNPADRVDPATGEISIGVGDTDGTSFTVTATLPAALGGGTTQPRTVQIGPAWRDDPHMPVTSIVVGGGWPGTTLPDTAPNVLFLSDGYLAADEGAFHRTVTTEVHHLKTDRLLRPYDLLCKSMNFWSAFVPAGARGIALRCEVYRDDDGDYWPVPPPEEPPATGKWNIGHLIFSVGLPVAADGVKDAPGLLHAWETLVGPLPRPRIPVDVIEDWKCVANRAFVQEPDNFPGMAFGAPPAADTKSGTPTLSLHPDRCGRIGLDRFLAALQSVSGVQFGPGANIGAVWARPPLRQNLTDYALKDIIRVVDNTRPVFVCTSAGISDLSEPTDYFNAVAGATIADGSAEFRAAQATFNNSRYVIVLSSFPAGRPRNNRRDRNVPAYVATCVRSGNHKLPLAAAASGMGLALNITGVAADAPLDACRVTAHELAHSLGLGDEYVDHERPYPFAQPDGLNLQTEDNVSTDDEIDVSKIRWNWHRVRKAAVVRDAITPVAAGAFRIPVVAGQATRFSLNDIVLLRLRVPGLGLRSARDTTVSGALQIAVAPSASASADYVVVQVAPGVTIEPHDFIPGSILFAPVQAPSSVRDAHDYPFAEMVAKNVKDLMHDHHAPLYNRPARAHLTDEMQRNREIQHPNLDGLTPGLPGRPFCFKVQPKIVGLYGGGAQYARGIFHPTGLCIMRNAHVETTEFCAVCRYVMVDLVNPVRHFEIDRDYEDIYPLK
jgi:IgA Peptidase M64